MRIAVTGARGRLGSAVVGRAVAAGHRVLGLDLVGDEEDLSESLSYRRLDATSFEAVARAFEGCDAVVHLAAHTSPRGRAFEVHNDNVIASYNALIAAAELGITRVCQASSINAIGAAFSRWPRYDYFPLDEAHPTYNEDPYSLSKWICEIQADSVARAFPEITIASMRLHALVPDYETRAQRLAGASPEQVAKDLWGFTTTDGAASACLAALTARYEGHEVFYIVARRTASVEPSQDLRKRYYPEVPVREELVGNRAFYDSSKAESMLGWVDER